LQQLGECVKKSLKRSTSKTIDDIGASSSEIENSSSEDEDEEGLVDNCRDNETDDQGHSSEDN
ncbi:unnamed protein product, partial [Didymodactylos carnosus]